MKSFKKNMVPTKRSTIVVFLLSIVIIIATYFVSQSMVMSIELDDFTTFIQKDTKENLFAAKNLLNGMVADLENTAVQIQKCDDLMGPKAREILEFSQRMNLFDVTFLANADGSAYSASGHEFSVANQTYFRKATETGKVTFSEILPSKKFDAIQVIAYPFFSDSQELQGVLLGLFKVETFSHLINAVVDQYKYIYVVDSNGTYINRFDTTQVLPDHENFWDSFDSWQLQDMTVEELKADFQAGNEGDFSYRSGDGDTNYFSYHMPLGVQDWQMVLTVEDAAVNSHIHSIRMVGSISLAINMICLVTMLLCIYSYFKTANRKIIAINQKISKNNEMLRIALEHSKQVIFEYDINKKQIELQTALSCPPFDKNIISLVPDCILATNSICDASVSVLKELFQTIEHEKSSHADIQFVNSSQKKRWYRVSMYNIYSAEGHIISTVGSAEDITLLKKGEDAIKRKEEMYKSFIANALLYARVDLSTDTVIELNGKEMHAPYQGYLNRRILENVCDEHHSYVSQALSLATLRKNHRQGKEFVEVQYLVKTAQNPRWVSCLVHRIHMSDSPKVTFLIRDIDIQKRKEINDSFGHLCGDQVLVDIANTLKSRFRSSDIIGRLGGDEFVIMLRNLRSDKYADTLINELIASLTKTYVQDGKSVTISASMGVAHAPFNGVTFEELYKKADDALYRVKKEGKNGYRRCQDDGNSKVDDFRSSKHVSTTTLELK